MHSLMIVWDMKLSLLFLDSESRRPPHSLRPLWPLIKLRKLERGTLYEHLHGGHFSLWSIPQMARLVSKISTELKNFEMCLFLTMPPLCAEDLPGLGDPFTYLSR